MFTVHRIAFKIQMLYFRLSFSRRERTLKTETTIKFKASAPVWLDKRRREPLPNILVNDSSDTKENEHQKCKLSELASASDKLDSAMC